ncbi:MAG: peptidylprolyl isomerase [Gammaproteobacteria bacterium]|nr:peptidylprolyl isomerase [Gammaproteobacteria bacterium]
MVTQNTVVTFHYDLREADGTFIESSRDLGPVTILHGHGNVIAGLEEALAERSAGDRFSVMVPPASAYGERIEGMMKRVSKKHLRCKGKLKPGVQALITHTNERVVVVKVGSKMVDVDLNHPLSGRTLEFAVEVLSVREADAAEIAHGHVHRPGGDAH